MNHLPFQDSHEFDVICNTKPKEGPERKAGYRLLSSKVMVNTMSSTNPSRLGGQAAEPMVEVSQSSEQQQQSQQSQQSQQPQQPQQPQQQESSTSPRIRILCVIYTYGGAHHRLRGIRETWAWRCDGFFAASTQTVEHPTEDGFGAVDLPHVGAEEYQNMWQKVRSIWSYVHDNYVDDFDYFFICGDDTHVIVENLRNFLTLMRHQQMQQNAQQQDPHQSFDDIPLYTGHWIPRKTSYYVGGGPGYVLNRKTLRVLVNQAFPVCNTQVIAAAEDRYMSNCLRNQGIFPNSSIDVTGAQRFHGMDANFVASFKGDRGFYKEVYSFWASKAGGRSLSGFDIVSAQSVSFHLLKTVKAMKRHHAILYRSCPASTVLGSALMKSDKNRTFIA